jgi:hypothetical protein
MVTVVHASHFTFDTASWRVTLSVISRESIFITLSHALSHAFSAGDHLSGATIMNIQGFSISTFAPIHSNSPLRVSMKFFDSTGGK